MANINIGADFESISVSAQKWKILMEIYGLEYIQSWCSPRPGFEKKIKFVRQKKKRMMDIWESVYHTIVYSKCIKN